jgi:mRNA interferase MazF
VSSPWPLTRGRVYAATLSHVGEQKYYLVVSNNRRNEKLPQVLAVRLTTTPKPLLPSVVEIPAGESFVGRALCDDIVELYGDEVQLDLGAFSPRVMLQIDRGLKAALGLS